MDDDQQDIDDAAWDQYDQERRELQRLHTDTLRGHREWAVAFDAETARICAQGVGGRSGENAGQSLQQRVGSLEASAELLSTRHD